MKLVSTKTAVVQLTVEEVENLLKKFVEKKTGKKIESVAMSEGLYVFNVVAEVEESNLDQQ